MGIICATAPANTVCYLVGGQAKLAQIEITIIL